MVQSSGAKIDAVRESAEYRSEAYFWYGERGTEGADKAMRDVRYTRLMSGGNEYLDRLKKKLYSREGEPQAHERSGLTPSMDGIERTWNEEEHTPATTLPTLSTMQKTPHHHRTLVIFLGALLFFVISLGVAAFVYLRGGNLVSSQNIDLEIVAPTLVDGGKEVSLQILIRNSNAAPLRLADLILEYPEGTRSASDLTQSLTSVRESVGDIAAGEQVKKTASAVLFGEEGAHRTIKATLEYRIEGSNAIFVKEGSVELIIGSSPVTLTVEGPKEAISGKEFGFTVTVVSNATALLRDVVVQVEYPFGWSITNSSPETSSGDNMWYLGDLKPREERKITLEGRVEGTDNEERVFRFLVGSQDDPTENKVAVPFLTLPHALVIRKPFVSGTLALNGMTTKTVAVFDGKDVHGTISWQNNLDAQVSDLEIVGRIQGLAYNKSSVVVSRGFWRSADATMIWDKSQDPALAVVAPGGNGQVDFTFTPKAVGLKNPELTIDVELRAKRTMEGDVPEIISSAITARVVVASPLTLEGKLLRFAGPFQNRGPIPPKADQESTYTVVWSIDNPSNTLANVRVSATLPPSTIFISAVSPATEDVSFNPTTNAVSWLIGEMRAGTKRDASFQIGFTPSVTQVGFAPVIFGETTLTADDRFAGVRVTDTEGPLTTRFNEDPSFQNGMEVVAQ